MITKEQATELEQLIDREGLTQVLRAIAEIRYEKSAHIEENWISSGAEDRETAALACRWSETGRQIDLTANKARSRGL